MQYYQIVSLKLFRGKSKCMHIWLTLQSCLTAESRILFIHERYCIQKKTFNVLLKIKNLIRLRCSAITTMVGIAL